MRAQFSGTLPERGSVSTLERREVLPTDKRPEEKWRGVVSQCAPSGWHSWQRWLEHEDVAKKKKTRGTHHNDIPKAGAGPRLRIRHSVQTSVTERQRHHMLQCPCYYSGGVSVMWRSWWKGPRQS